MGLWGRTAQAHDAADSAAVKNTPGAAAFALLRRFLASTGASGLGQWRALAESGLIGLGGIVISALFIWAALTDRLSVESIVVVLVLLILTLFAVGQGMRYYARNLRLQARAREAAAKTTVAAEILMEFLREFTLQNQEVISRLADAQKARAIEEIGRAVDDLVRSVGDPSLRQELLQLKEALVQKVAEIPTGVVLPLPRLEYFDQALRQIEEPERTPPCPACGARRAQVSGVDGRAGIHYVCVQCGHKFSLGIAVMLEKSG
jgi:hypothetical protein